MILNPQFKDILFYISAFGLSDLFIKKFKLNDRKKFIYYCLILLLVIYF